MQNIEFLSALLYLLHNQVSILNCGFITEDSPNVILITNSYQSDGKLGILSSWLPLLCKCCLCSCQFEVCFAVITWTPLGFFCILFYFNNSTSSYFPNTNCKCRLRSSHIFQRDRKYSHTQFALKNVSRKLPSASSFHTFLPSCHLVTFEISKLSRQINDF